MMTNPVVILSGPTASGKTALSLEIAKRMDAVIINADSKQVFREIPILSAQPTIEERGAIPHYLFGCLSIAQECSVARWIEMAVAAIQTAQEAGKTPVLVGGTGMYVHSLVHGLSPIPTIDADLRGSIRKALAHDGAEALHGQLAAKDAVMAAALKPGDSQRVARAYEVICQTGISLHDWQRKPRIFPIEPSLFRHFFLHADRQKIYDNCNQRFDGMVDQGVLEEVEKIDAMALSPELPGMRAHGLPELLQYLHGEMELDEAIRQAKRNTRHYIKRQFTWFRSQMPEATALVPEAALSDSQEQNKQMAQTVVDGLAVS